MLFRSGLAACSLQVDATAHRDLGSRFGVQGFPTLKFFPASESGEVIDFNGNREVDDFVTFLEKNAAIKFNLEGEDHSEL